MTVSAYITAFALEYDHNQADATIVKWINLLEDNVYNEILKDYAVHYYNRVVNGYQHSLPSGVSINDVVSLYVGGRRYRKKDTRAYNEYRTYWYEGSKLSTYPRCSVSDTSYVSAAEDITFKAIAYTSGAGELTFASGTIVTTGDSFVTAGFVVGNSITISGCTENSGNNKVVVITAVTATTITVATGTFTAGTETGVVVLATNCIYTAGNDFSGFTVGDIVQVSGCTDETGNNIYAKSTAVASTVLTFAAGTFTAQAESAAVTITAPKIKMTYVSIPDWKDVANIETDELTLPDRFQDAYDYYNMSKIAYLDREYKEAQNHMAMAMSRIKDFEDWYENRRPSRPEEDIIALEERELDYEGRLDFDNC